MDLIMMSPSQCPEEIIDGDIMDTMYVSCGNYGNGPYYITNDLTNSCSGPCGQEENVNFCPLS